MTRPVAFFLVYNTPSQHGVELMLDESAMEKEFISAN
jgi:hypothetical protein